MNVSGNKRTQPPADATANTEAAKKSKAEVRYDLTGSTTTAAAAATANNATNASNDNSHATSSFLEAKNNAATSTVNPTLVTANPFAALTDHKGAAATSHNTNQPNPAHEETHGNMAVDDEPNTPSLSRLSISSQLFTPLDM
mmetsp:Transcript_24885/g.44262  ORF Transcript_24885/g.44262 Transcript_24885/m.44262 type:complete len:142 (+) Transcript_24885:551-976(+)